MANGEVSDAAYGDLRAHLLALWDRFEFRFGGVQKLVLALSDERVTSVIEGEYVEFRIALAGTDGDVWAMPLPRTIDHLAIRRADGTQDMTGRSFAEFEFEQQSDTLDVTYRVKVPTEGLPGPEGPEGPQGPPGEDGDDGRSPRVFRQLTEPADAQEGDFWIQTDVLRIARR